MYKQNQIYIIVWSPNSSDRFIKLFSKQIELYEIKLNGTEENAQCVKISVHNETEAIKCISWQPYRNMEMNSSNNASIDILAIGLSSGVIRIISFGDQIYESDEYNLADKELRPKFIKQSTFLEWNPWQRSMLAQGIDKSKGSWGNEPSVLIWELQKDCSNRVVSGTSSQHSYHQQISGISTMVNTTKVNTEYCMDQATFDFCRGDVVNSFAWINRRKFICGINNKCLKVFEITENQPSKIVNTDAVYGLCMNTKQENIFASFIDEKIVIWREDSLEKPLLTYSELNSVETVEWSPLRDGNLCVTFKDKSYIKVLDTKIALLNSTQEVEHSLIDRVLKSSEESIIISATWHRKIENCLCLYLTDEKFEFVHLRNRRLVSWSVQQKLVCSMDTTLNICYYKKDIMSLSDISGNNIEQYSNENKNHFNEIVESIDLSQDYLKQDSYNFLDNDIGFVMKERALCGYGLKPSPKDLPYSTMFKDNQELRTFWKWIEDSSVSTYGTENYPSKSKISSFSGVIDCIRDVVKVSYNRGGYDMFILYGPVSTAEDVRWNFIYDVLPFPKYNHEYRDKIFAVCGWPFNKKIETWRFNLESITDKERAAAIALVTLNFDLALQYLKRLTNDKGLDTEMLRLCLAGFNTQSGQTSNSNWSSICRDVLKKLGNSRPYLRLIFNFLIVSNKNDLQFIKNSNILLLDKIAIATLYMDDDNLIEFMNSIAISHLKCGNLEAVIMTGLRSNEFIDLLQAYIDRTYDVQTTAIAVLQANVLTKNALGKTKVSSQWIESYRHFLDNWSMWFVRADFDIANQYMNFSTNAEAPSKSQKPTSYFQNITKSGLNLQKSSINQTEVYVACNYCYGKISHSSKYVGSSQSTGTASRTRPDGTGVGNTSISSVAMHAGGCKATICQNCRKPLPRCSVCLMNMGTISDSSRTQTLNMAIFSNKDDQLASNPIWSWFIWCQKCKHGGHAGHLQSWFLEWPECPVSGCKCSCSGLDSSFSLSNEFYQKIELTSSE